MKTLAVVSFLLSMCLLAGCDSETLVAPESNEDFSFETLTPGLLQSENAATHSNSNVYTFADMEEVGSSNLARRDNGVSFIIKTTGLNPGNTYTLWMAVFNNPAECDGGCDGSDLGNPDVQGDLLYSAGSLAGGTGKATFAGSRKVGDTDGSEAVEIFDLDMSYGIIDSRKAEIHFVVRDHGPKIPGLMREQISTIGGGCDVNACDDVQFSIHLPE